jgi:hypothetical protein
MSESFASNPSTYPITSQDQKVILALRQYGFSRIRIPHDEFLHHTVAQGSSHRQYAIHPIVHHEAAQIRNPFGFLRI